MLLLCSQSKNTPPIAFVAGGSELPFSLPALLPAPLLGAGQHGGRRIDKGGVCCLCSACRSGGGEGVSYLCEDGEPTS